MTNVSLPARVWYQLEEAFDQCDALADKRFCLSLENGRIKLTASCKFRPGTKFFLEIPQAKVLKGLNTDEWNGLHSRIVKHVIEEDIQLCQ